MIYIKNILLKTCAICLLIFLTIPLTASNYVTIATLGDYPESVDKTMGMQNVVDQVIRFWDEKIEQVLPYDPDLIVLPEVCDLPGGLNRDEKMEYFRVRANQITDHFASIAKKHKTYIAFGSYRRISDDERYNSLVVLDRKGEIAGIYDKNFPTVRDLGFGTIAGTKADLIQCDFGQVACVVCFDLNFDELLQRYAEAQPDIILFSSFYHGGMVQNFWAYKCRSFFAGAVVGGESEIRNPLGQVLAASGYYNYAVATINLDSRLVHGDFNRDKIIKLKEKYKDKVTITDPGKLGFMLLSSADKRISVDEMIQEFDIELLDDYFDRSREVRSNQINNLGSQANKNP